MARAFLKSLLAKEHAGLGIIDHKGQLIGGKVQVQRDQNGPDLGEGTINFRVDVRIGMQDGDPVPFADSRLV